MVLSPLSIAVLLIRKAGFSLSKLTRKKNPLLCPNYSYRVILVLAIET